MLRLGASVVRRIAIAQSPHAPTAVPSTNLPHTMADECIRIDGKVVGATVEEGLIARVKALADAGATPHLAVVIVGDDPASHVYVANKVSLTTSHA